MENEMIPLSPDDRFTFGCHPDVPCFNECCRDLTQFLTPYDILRLKTHLGMTAGEFLKQYTKRHIGPETGLPVVVLRQDPASGLTCPFVTERGCRVYPDRPSSCRTYPLARVAGRSPETGRIVEQYVLMKEAHCRGFCETSTFTVREWVTNQEMEPYNRMNDLMMEIIGYKKRLHPRPLDVPEQQLFHLACYDLDAFRTEVFDRGILEPLQMNKAILQQAEADDTLLLRLGLQWIKHALFGVR